MNKSGAKSRKSSELLSKVPHVKRSSVSRAELASDQRRLVAILSESLLIAKRGGILSRISSALSVNFLIENGLLTQMSEGREVEIKQRGPSPHAVNALLIIEISADGKHADKNTVFGEGTGEPVPE